MKKNLSRFFYVEFLNEYLNILYPQINKAMNKVSTKIKNIVIGIEPANDNRNTFRTEFNVSNAIMRENIWNICKTKRPI